MNRKRWPRLGLRREMLILLPVTVLLLVLVAGFTLFSYRSAVDLLLEDRQREILAISQKIATDLSAGPLPTSTQLREQVPTAIRITIADAEGRPVRSFGQLASGSILAPLEDQPPTRAIAVGPSSITGEAIVGYAPFSHQGPMYLLRIDVPSLELARQKDGVRVLTWVVLPTSVALLLLALLFLPHFLRPYDMLVEQVQRVATDPGDQDEVSMLVSTVDRALAALVAATGDSQEDDFSALQRTLGASLESGLLLLDHRGSVLTLNDLGSALLEVDPVTEAVPLIHCLQPHPELIEMLNRAVEGATGLPRQEMQIRTSEGHRTLGFTVHALRRDDGTVRGHLALFVDLTESQREAEALHLATSLEQLGELAAGVAHELRNSLATTRSVAKVTISRGCSRTSCPSPSPTAHGWMQLICSKSRAMQPPTRRSRRRPSKSLPRRASNGDFRVIHSFWNERSRISSTMPQGPSSTPAIQGRSR
jgi:PAS domain-containing protein